MADLWELICHHTYRGIPGVVVDTAPEQPSHGRAIGLDDADFLYDGATPGSGSVRFYDPNGRVQVTTQAPQWRRLGGIKAEVRLRRQPSLGFILDGGSFQFHVRGNTLDTPVAWFASYPTQYSEIAASLDPVGPTPYRIPAGQWVSLGFKHDGFGTLELSADGEVVARRTGTYAPIAAPGSAGLNIGNAASGGLFCNGEIDDVKIWRLNPHFVDDNFSARPMDPATAECWRRFRTALDAALLANPDCAKKLLGDVRAAMDNFLRQVMAKGPESKHHLKACAREYERHWRSGTVDAPKMIDAFVDFLDWLGLVGISLDTDPTLAALAASPCFQEVLAKMPPFDCDPKLMHLLRSVANAQAGKSKAKRAAT